MSIRVPGEIVDRLHERSVAFNTRLLELARHNGFEIELRVPCDHAQPLERCRWRVPQQLVPIVGYMIALVEKPHGR